MKDVRNVAIFTGGKAPSFSLARDFLLLHRPDYVIAADSGIELCLEYQKEAGNDGALSFTPDLILGDFDSIKDSSVLDGFDKNIIERHSSYKDFTDTELSLKRARELFPSAFVTLVGGAGIARADHFLGIYNLFGTELSPSAWICGEQVFYNAAPSFFKSKKFLIRGLKEKDVVSIARAQGFKCGGSYRSHGLEWESGLFRKRGMPSISNRISSRYLKEKRPVEITFFRGRFVLILPLSAHAASEASRL